MIEMPTVPCKTCGTPTTYLGTRHCNDCHEVELRLRWYLDRGGAKARAFVRAELSRYLDAETQIVNGKPLATIEQEDLRPDFSGFAASLRDESFWSHTLHGSGTGPNDKTKGQAASDQRALNELADRVEMVGKRLGFWCEVKKS